MPTVAYLRTLTSDTALSANWRYALVIPGALITASGGAFRLRFDKPLSGASQLQAVFAGKRGAGAYDFAGHPSAITVGGQTSFANNGGWSDPVAGEVVAGQDLVVCFDAIGGSGRAYRRDTAAAGHLLYYMSGLGGGANANVTKSGYSVVADLAATISGIEVAETVTDFGAPVENPGDDPTAGMAMQEWGIKAIDGDQIFARGDFIAGQPGKHLHVNLNSAPTSGKAVYLWSIEVTPDADTAFSLRSLLPDAAGADWVNIPAICNANFTTPETYATARLKKGFADTILGGLHSVGTLKSGQMKMIYLPHCPLVKVYPNFTGVCLALHSAGVGATVTFHWQELPV